MLAGVACGGVREQIGARPASASIRFDTAELVDVLPVDRIGAIERPVFESSAKAGEWLDPSEPAVVLRIGEDVRAYPLSILVWHEIVGDTVGGVPVAVTYSPLTNAAVAFDRRVGGRTERFGVSGKLFRSNLVMFDRRTSSLWPQLAGRAVAGPSQGRTLARLPVQIASLKEFRNAYPNGIVLARPEGSGRAYGFNPYEGYDSRRGSFGGFVAVRTDPREGPMGRVLGVRQGASARAYPYPILRRARVLAGRLGGRDIVVLWRPGTRSALDTPRLRDGRDVGSAGAFYAEIGGDRLDLTASADGFRDRRTGSVWSVLGVATAGPMNGKRLEPALAVDTFWFAWAAFNPETTIAEGTR